MKSTVVLKTYKYDSPIGDLVCVLAGPFLVKLDFQAQTTDSKIEPLPDSMLRSEFDAYFAGKLRSFKQAIKLTSGTEFERKIWHALKEIPYGETRSYRWIAEFAGSPKAVRAAGQALGKNPLPIILPCHRVIASDGSPGGYTGGLSVKEWLLNHEKKS